MLLSGMNPAQWAVVLSMGIFVGLVACLEVGYRIGRRSSQQHPELAHEGIGVIEAAVFALLGLLLGFSFAGGTSRLDSRRQLIVQEANYWYRLPTPGRTSGRRSAGNARPVSKIPRFTHSCL
jgi:hypothetical protein